MKINHTFDDGTSAEADVTGAPVFFGMLILFLPFLGVFGLTMPTWTLIAVGVVGFLHFWVSVFAACMKNVLAKDRAEKAKEQSEKSSGE
jgi:hypothetical protein